MRLGYFTNQYPGVSHTFIRREIQAVENLGATVFRYALRPGLDLVDPADKDEKDRTRYILSSSATEIIRCLIKLLLTRPHASGKALLLAIKIGWRSDRGLLRHFAYFVEAVVLAQWCYHDGVDHLHAHFGTNPATIAMLASQLSGIPYSFTVHGPDEFERATLLSLDVKLKNAAFVNCVSAFGRSQLMRWSPPDLWPKISIVHCGLDAAFFEEPLKPPPQNNRFVCIGRLSPQKGQLVLVAAASRLHNEGLDCEIVFAGDGPMRHQIENSVQQAGLKNKVTITSWIPADKIRAEIAAARAVILPSFAENLPVVIMEALALGRPVISTYIAGIPELVRPERTGWLVPAGDEIALAEVMREVLLKVSVDQLARMGLAGRAHVIEHHDCVKEAMKLKRLFEVKPQSCLQKANRPTPGHAKLHH